MNSTMVVIVGIAGLAVGAIVAYWVALRQTKSSEGRAIEAERNLAVAQTKLLDVERLEGLAAQRETLADDLRAENAKLSERAAKLEAEVEARQAAFEEAQKQLSIAFEATAARVLAGQRERFLDDAKQKLEHLVEVNSGDLKKRQEAIDLMLKPFKENLTALTTQINEIEKSRAGAYEGLTKQVESLMQSQQTLHKDTASLTQALKGSSQRGRWGEIQLRRLVEIAEMTAYCDFSEQAPGTSEEGRQRPDLVIRLPDRASIIVDSKAPYNLWSDAEEDIDAETRLIKMREFAKQVRTAITGLGSRGYKAEFGSVDFVVMFLPGEHYLADALRADPELIVYGFDKRVLLATPTTLLALLRTIYQVWQNAKLADAAKKVAEEGRKMHKNVALFAERFEEVKKRFRKAEEALDDTETSQRRILSTAIRLEKLGAKSEKSLPATAAVEALEDEAFEVDESPMPLPPVDKADEAVVAGLFDDPEPVN